MERKGEVYFKYEISDPQKMIQLSHYYGDWGFGEVSPITNQD